MCRGFDLALTFGKYPEALLFRHGEWIESSDESSAENEAPKLKPPKKLSVPKDKENQLQFVDNAKEAALN